MSGTGQEHGRIVGAGGKASLYCFDIAVRLLAQQCKFKHCLSPLCLPMIHIIGATFESRRIRKLHGKAISQDRIKLIHVRFAEG